MRHCALLCAAFIAGIMLVPPAFGADSGTSNSAGDIYGEIVQHVWDDALTLPKNPEACADALYAWQNAEEACGDAYARRLSAAEFALMEEQDNTPVVGELRGTIGIIRWNAFGDETDINFMKQALALLKKGATELRLDLRDNLGGMSGPDLKILYLFSQEHDRFETRRYRNKTEIYDAASVRMEFELTYPPGILRDIPTAVWINNNSASASEVVAGAMKDWGYPVRGTNSRGKGIGQKFFPLPDGSFVRLTTFEFFVGNSQTKIHGIGVTPTHPLPDEMRE